MTPPSLPMKQSFTSYPGSPCIGLPADTLTVMGSPSVQTRQSARSRGEISNNTLAAAGSPSVQTRWSGRSHSGESSGHRFGRPGVAAWLFIRPRSSQPGNLPATPCPLGLLTCPEDPPPRDQTFGFSRGGEPGCEDRFRANGHGSRRIGLLSLVSRSERERERETERRPARWAGPASLHTRTSHAAVVSLGIPRRGKIPSGGLNTPAPIVVLCEPQRVWASARGNSTPGLDGNPSLEQPEVVG